jgi:hypothetical protein
VRGKELTSGRVDRGSLRRRIESTGKQEQSENRKESQPFPLPLSPLSPFSTSLNISISCDAALSATSTSIFTPSTPFCDSSTKSTPPPRL